MKSMHKITKLSLSFIMIVMMLFSLSVLSNAASDEYTTIIADKDGTIGYNESFSQSFTLNYNSQVRIFFNGYKSSSHGTYGKHKVEIKNDSGEVVYTASGNTSYDNKEYLTEELPSGDYTLYVYCDSTSTSSDFDFCLNLSYKVLEDVPVESIALDKSTLYLCPKDKATLNVKFTPAESNGKTATWKSSNTKVATVSTTGEVTAVAKGTATITATAGGKSATCKVTVFSTSGKSYRTMVSYEGTIYRDKSQTHTFTLSTYSRLKISFTDDTYGDYEINIKDKNGKVVYSVEGESSYDEVSHTVNVLPKGTYTFSLTATSYDLDYDYKISYMPLEDIPVKTVTLNKSTLNICNNDKVTLKATVAPTDADNKKVTWKSSNTKVATVSSSGEVKGIAKGTATITATAGGKKATCKVTVFSTDNRYYKTLVSTQQGVVEKGEVKKSKFTLNTYSRIKISFTGFDSNAYEGTWGGYEINIKDSNGKVVYTVKGETEYDDKSHTIKVLPKGTYTFNLTPVVEYSYGDWDDDFNYIYKISYMTVADVKINKVKLSSTSVTLAKGKTTTLTATPDPSYVTKKTTWSSSNTKVATVNSSGKITAKALGTATITAKIGDKKATCSVKVGSASATVIKKRSTSLASYITNISGYKNATWSTSNSSIATVDRYGKVYGKSNGTCSVYCTINKVKYTFNITVKPAVSASVYYIKDTDIYNEISLKLVNNTNLKITYITMNINQYDNRGYKLKSPYSSFEFNDTLNANSSCYTEEYWVNDATKKATVTVKKVWFSDGTTWTP